MAPNLPQAKPETALTLCRACGILFQVIVRGLKNILLILLLLAVTGGQWAVLQSAAWAGMLVEHLRTQSISSAVVETFDGKHPCPMCMAIERGKKSEKKSEIEVKIVRVEFLPANAGSLLPARDLLRSDLDSCDEFAESLPSRPRLRPPCLTRV